MSIRLTAEPSTVALCRINVGYADLRVDLRPWCCQRWFGAQLPTGTVTFLMTDIEGSTRLLQTLGDHYPQLLADHYRLLREAFGSTGVEVRSEGDALFYVFVDAPSAVRAA